MELDIVHNQIMQAIDDLEADKAIIDSKIEGLYIALKLVRGSMITAETSPKASHDSDVTDNTSMTLEEAILKTLKETRRSMSAEQLIDYIQSIYIGRYDIDVKGSVTILCVRTIIDELIKSSRIAKISKNLYSCRFVPYGDFNVGYRSRTV